MLHDIDGRIFVSEEGRSIVREATSFDPKIRDKAAYQRPATLLKRRAAGREDRESPSAPP